MELNLIASERRRPWRAYVLALLVAIAALFFLLFAASANSASTRPIEGASKLSTSDSIAAVEAINDFAAFTREWRKEPLAISDNAYIAEGLRSLAAAIYSLTNRADAGPPGYGSAASELLEAAYIVERPDRSEMHSDVVHAALVNTSSAMAEAQRARYPKLVGAMTYLLGAVRSVRANRTLATQKEPIQRFFERARDVLQGMVEVGL